jgi:hypothetical protein
VKNNVLSALGIALFTSSSMDFQSPSRLIDCLISSLDSAVRCSLNTSLKQTL